MCAAGLERQTAALGLRVALASVLPACFHPSYDHPTCGPHGECPDDFTCLQSDHVCLSPLERLFDSADDFATGQLVNMTIEPHGSLTPDAYTYGGLVAHGLPSALWDSDHTDWSAIDQVTTAGAGLWRGEPLTSGGDLRYLGLAKGSTNIILSIWFEGEIWFDVAAPQETLGLEATGIAFLDLAPPGTTAYQRILDSSSTSPSAPFRPTVTGWYPVRIGFANDQGTGSFQFLHGSGGSMVAWTRNRLRARASALRGALRTVFFQQMLGGGDVGVPPVTHFEDRDLLPKTVFNPVPQGTTNPWDWSARYVGQVYIEQSGNYTLQVTSDGGNRGRLGSIADGTDWAREDFSRTGSGSPTSVVTTQVPAMLTAGWNDLRVDYTHVDHGQTLQVTLAGPDVPTIAVPPERLRPVESADDRIVNGSDDANHAVPLAGGAANAAISTMPVLGYPGETVNVIDVLYQVNPANWAQLQVDLEAPTPSGPRRITIPSPKSGTDDHAQLTIPAGAAGEIGKLLGGPANGTWKLYVYYAAASTSTTSLTFVRLTLHTEGGPSKIAPIASWTSQVLDFGSNVSEIEHVTWDERLAEGAMIAVGFRSCQKADCSDGNWSPPIPRAMPIAIAPARYVQLRVDMTSNGDVEPELRSLELRCR